jgi:hypothetical protein
MNALDLLKNDHAVMKELFGRYHEMEPGDAPAKRSLFKRLRDELTWHTQIEEEIFYPAVRGARTPEAERFIREAYEEHRLVKQILQDLGQGRPGSDEFDAKFKVLKENVLHHAEEEERDVFFQAREHFSVQELEQLGLKMSDRKHKLGGSLHRSRGLATKAKRAVLKVKQLVSRSVDRVRSLRASSRRGSSSGSRRR